VTFFNSMSKRILLILFLCIGYAALTHVHTSFAQELTATPTPNTSTSSIRKEEKAKVIEEIEKKLVEVRTQKNTLSSQITYMDTQIYVAGLRINQTEEKVVDTEKEINVLGARITNLDSSLDKLSETLLNRIVAGYKNRTVDIADILLDSTNASKLVNRLKYYDLAKERNQKALLQVQEAKSNFEEQKDLREKKAEQLAELKDQLAAQERSLNTQQDEKTKLLADTQNSEKVYQKRLEEARSQLNSFQSFVQNSGAAGVIAANSFGSGSDGAYYSQRDQRWASQTIGYSNNSVLNVGCLLTTIAMFAKIEGVDIDPSALAQDTNRFWGNTAWMKLPWPGVSGRSYSSVSDIDSELANGNPVIVGVKIDNCASGGNHFVLITKKEGSDYIMHDPIYGPDLKFSSHYSTICSKATFK